VQQKPREVLSSRKVGRQSLHDKIIEEISRMKDDRTRLEWLEVAQHNPYTKEVYQRELFSKQKKLSGILLPKVQLKLKKQAREQPPDALKMYFEVPVHRLKQTHSEDSPSKLHSARAKSIGNLHQLIKKNSDIHSARFKKNKSLNHIAPSKTTPETLPSDPY
jgi:hypothetical protein